MAEALDHPTWTMGPKITVDSATMMNKALEIIEARWLFDLRPEQIDVVIHPQSIVHSLVEFVDGSVLAQLSPPDMRLPIQYALTYPRAACRAWPRGSIGRSAMQLEFEPPDLERFPALELGYEVARAAARPAPCSTRPTRRPWPAFWPASCVSRHRAGLPQRARASRL